jgi:hypothetical protein
MSLDFMKMKQGKAKIKLYIMETIGNISISEVQTASSGLSA